MNWVQVTVIGLKPVQIEKDFYSELVFWGGGVDTQNVLPSGASVQVNADLERNIESPALGGGLVFSIVHNIQADGSFSK